MTDSIRPKVDLFLDSGAYSAFTQHKTIKIEEYIQFIKDNMEVISIYANLDVIGDAEATWKNQMIMEDAGLTPLPTYHFGEDISYLYKYLDSYDYMCLGGLVGASTFQLKSWLDPIFQIICDTPDRMPKLKVHGFGLTSFTLITRYPWYCMTEEDHTVFTKTGWKNVSELYVGEDILSYNQGKMEWQKIEEIPIFEVKDEEIYHLKNRNFSAFVTGNHRWLTSDVCCRDSKYTWRTTETLLTGDCINRIGKDYDFPIEKKYTDSQISLLAWFWTDGTINKRKKYKTNSISIYQSEKTNPEKCQIIRDLLISSNEKFCEMKQGKDGCISFELYGDICTWLLSMAPNKKLPESLPFELTKEQSKKFLDYSILADGSKTNLKRIKGFDITVSREVKKENLEVLRNICFLLGIPTSISGKKSKYTGLRSSSVKHIYMDTVKKQSVNYTGKLWCVKIPCGAFFTKCQDKIYVTGNSIDSTSWVMTGRMGSIFVPRYRGGKWIYDENAWKIAVSNRSPSTSDAGKHITTLLPENKRIFFQYLEDKGYSLGISEYKKEDQSYQLAENERWVGKKPTDKKAKREVEIRIKDGISNRYELRDEMNIIYFLELEKQLPEWPWPFKRTEGKHEFFK